MMPFSTVASSAEASAALAMISMASSTTSHSSAYSSTHTSASASPLKKRPLICDSCRVARKRCDTLKPACSRCVARGGACRYSSAPPALLLSAQSPPAANENSKNENNKNENKNENENKNKKNKSEKAAKACLWCHRKKTRCDMRRPQCKTCAAKARVCEYASAGVTREVPLKLDMRVIPVGDDCHEEEMLREEAHKRLLVRARLDSLIGELAAADDSDPTPPALVSPSSESSASSTSSASSAISASLSDYSSQHYPLPLSHSSNLALANVVVARFPPKPPGSPLVKLSCGKLWIEDPVTSEKFYFCPACKKEYGTANGLKYHLSQHTNPKDFPSGYYWTGKTIEENSTSGETYQELPFACQQQKCHKTYSSAGGLKYHLKAAHGVDVSNLELQAVRRRNAMKAGVDAEAAPAAASAMPIINEDEPIKEAEESGKCIPMDTMTEG